jgi:hypothetical protein
MLSNSTDAQTTLLSIFKCVSMSIENGGVTKLYAMKAGSTCIGRAEVNYKCADTLFQCYINLTSSRKSIYCSLQKQSMFRREKLGTSGI